MQQPSGGGARGEGTGSLEPDGKRLGCNGWDMDHLSGYLRMLWSVFLDGFLAPAALVVSGSLPGTTMEDLRHRPYGGHRYALGLYMIDCLLNGFINLVYIVAAGGLICARLTIKPRISTEDSSRGERPALVTPGEFERRTDSEAHAEGRAVWRLDRSETHAPSYPRSS